MMFELRALLSNLDVDCIKEAFLLFLLHLWNWNYLINI